MQAKDERATILVVDDEKTNIDALIGLLENEYRIIVAKNGLEALKKVQNDPRPDLILLDIFMPEMDGFEACRRLKNDVSTRKIPVIFITGKGQDGGEAMGFKLGAVDYVNKPFSPTVLKARIRTHLVMSSQKRFLQDQIKKHTARLLKTQEALRKAMGNLLTINVAPGVFWLQIPEAELRILCGCPSEVVKLLMRKGLNSPASKNGIAFETGPNAILLSDLLIQNGAFANMAEFPVLQMLYRQGMILPDHPNNTGVKPMIMGAADQVRAQMEYIHRGNYGLLSRQEIVAAGIDEHTADIMMRIKLKFAFGHIHDPDQFLDTLNIDENPKEIRNGVEVHRIGFNRFRFTYRGQKADINLNLPKDVTYSSPYPLNYYRLQRHYFAVLHTGEGDGWNYERPCMSSVLMFQGRIYLIDAAPGVLNSLNALGIDISEVEGVFHTHAHDDHFAGLPDLIRTDRRMKYFATPLVRSAVSRKFAALVSLDVGKFEQFFDIHDLTFHEWNKFGGLEVMPLYSPHPVETNLFLFRALDGSGYRTYAHWADLSSFKVLDDMIGDGLMDVPAEFIQKIKEDYLQRADLKKIDVGGGLIHGAAKDFVEDPSERIILAHLSRELTTREKMIGSETSFGAIDILIPGDQNHLRQRAYYYLQELFPEASNDDIRMLINGPILEYNAGSIIRRSGKDIGFMELILAGNILYLNADSGVHNRLGFGSFMGLRQIFHGIVQDKGRYRAASHAATLRISNPLFKAFLETNGIFEKLSGRLEKIQFLRWTWLFGEQTSFAFLDSLSQSMESITIPTGTTIEMGNTPRLWLIKTGRIRMVDNSGRLVEALAPGDFFGEHLHLDGENRSYTFQTSENCELFQIPWDGLLDAPIIHWKILEINEKRARISV